MTDQVTTPEAGAQPQETTTEVENPGQEQQTEQVEGSEQETAEQGEKVQKVVPLAALHEERAEKKRMREQMRVMEERFNQFQQAVTQRLQQPQQAQQQEVQIPDVNVDPVAHFRAENEQLKRQLEQLGRPVQEIQQRLQAQEQYQRVQMHVSSQLSDFAKEKPDVQDAIRHAQTADFQALRALGYDNATAQQMVVQQYDQMTFTLLQQGRNVAESIYALAQAKGYQPKQEAAGAQEKLQSQQKIAGAAKSLGSGGGVTQKLSLAALASMPADEFAKTVGDDAAWRKLMGG